MTPTPAGFMTRARADHLNQVFHDGVREILDRFALRAAERCTPESDPEKIRAILDEEAARAARELELFHAQFREQIYASEH